MHIRWLPEAAQDLEDINLYLREHHPFLAHSTMNELYDGIRSLKQMPYKGRPGSVQATRDLIFTRLPYIATYRIKEQTIEVLYIRHMSRNRS